MLSTKNWKTLLVSLSVSIQASCSFKVPNLEVCVELTRERAFCKYSLSENERFIEANLWRQERIGRLSLSPDDYGKVVKFIKKVCEKTEQCTYEEANEVEKFLNEIQSRSKQW